MNGKTKVVIGIILVLIVFAMAVAYSAFATELQLNGTAEIVGEWDIRITDIKTIDISDGCDDGEPQFTNTSATFNAKLVKPGDLVTYEVTIENAGTIDAALGTVIFREQENGSDAIKYTTTELANKLKAGEQTTFSITIEYDPETEEIPTVKTKTIIGVIEYVQDN